MTVKFLFVMTNKKARTTEVVIRTNILLSNKGNFSYTTTNNRRQHLLSVYSSNSFRPPNYPDAKQLFLRSSSGLRTS